jgi:hypothetical protein
MSARAGRTPVKPDTRTAMRGLIAEVRAAMPFGLPEAERCTGACDGCSQKLLDYLEGELLAWEQRLAGGTKPTLADLSRLAKTSKQIYAVLQRNGLVAVADAGAH